METFTLKYFNPYVHFVLIVLSVPKLLSISCYKTNVNLTLKVRGFIYLYFGMSKCGAYTNIKYAIVGFIQLNPFSEAGK